MKAMVYQMPLVQLAIIVLTVLLTEAEVIVKGKVCINRLRIQFSQLLAY